MTSARMIGRVCWPQELPTPSFRRQPTSDTLPRLSRPEIHPDSAFVCGYSEHAVQLSILLPSLSLGSENAPRPLECLSTCTGLLFYFLVASAGQSLGKEERLLPAKAPKRCGNIDGQPSEGLSLFFSTTSRRRLDLSRATDNCNLPNLGDWMLLIYPAWDALKGHCPSLR
ncbi:hypothetical protein IWX46DRAFT_373798 [Phyllosticta citricarpa]|uniref:Uncharacterized protein n=1 Tax=Phyllosticta citricarpa TaxID=55181 RepID=A0ABR1L7C5_9PEZI